ncbi:MAG: TIGR02266 family protein [Thermoanaerobaculia bacterium]
MERQRIVAVGGGAGLLADLEGLFASSAVDVQVVGDRESALALIQNFPIDLVLIEHPLRQGSLTEFVLEVSRNLAPEASVVVLAEEAQLAVVLLAVGDRFSVISRGDTASFRRRVGDHLRSWPAQPRLMVRLQVKLEEGGVDRMAQTENLSESGVLIRTKEPLPVGSEVELELQLPGIDEPLQLSGRVVRHADPHRETSPGMGIAFSTLSTEAAELLHEFVEKSLAEASA